MRTFFKLKGFAIAGLAVAGLSFTAPAKADYPEKPVEMTVLFGGTANSIAQLLSDLMSKNLDNPVVPVSRTGGGGAVGYSYLQGTSPDGYNIVWNSNSVNTSHHTGKMAFSYEDFTPIAQISREVPALAVNASSGWDSLADLAAAAKDGKKLKVGISGKGSFTHLTSAALFDAMGIGDKVKFISYGKGKAPVELLAGRIDAAIQWPGQFASYAKSGDLNVLAVTGDERVNVLPDVPTAQEQDVDVNIIMWRGLAAPKGTPNDVVMKLEAAAKMAVESDAFQDASKKIGFIPAFQDHETFAETIASDDEFYGDLLNELGLTK